MSIFMIFSSRWVNTNSMRLLAFRTGLACASTSWDGWEYSIVSKFASMSINSWSRYRPMIGSQSSIYRVECYSGSGYAERPTAVHWRGQRLAVEQVLRRWRTPTGPGFEVRVDGGLQLRLTWNEINDAWRVEELNYERR